MRFLFLAIFVLFSSFSWSQSEVTTQIHDVDMGSTIGDQALIFLSSGQVVKVSHQQLDLIEQLRTGKKSGAWFTITFNDEREITSIVVAEKPAPVVIQKSLNETTYLPSILSSFDEAKKYFYESTYHRKESQCFNRAHIWSFEWRKNHQFYSNKMWIYFTRKYVREHDFEWWFHVAPFIHVVMNGKVKQRVMDIKYSRVPLALKQWTDIFMRDDANCPVVESYSEHANYPESATCFVQKSSMYYYQPVDLEYLEKYGTERSAWVPAEVKAAYLEAFDITL